MRILWTVLLGAALGLGCGETSSGAAGGTGGSAGSDGSGGAGGARSIPIEVTEASFECILEGTKVRKFYVRNLLGDLEESVAVATGSADLPYPPGTVLQLVPQEAMVKREAGFSPETLDWEFFFLDVSPEGTTIAERGKDETENAFGLNCFACHSLARENDLICESDNGCDPLQIGDEVIQTLQTGDPRCE